MQIAATVIAGVILAAGAVFPASTYAQSQSPDATADPAFPPQPVVPPGQVAEPPPPVAPENLTDADRILQLQERIEKNMERLDSLKADLERADQTFEQEARQYNEIRKQIEEVSMRRQALIDSGDVDEAEMLGKALASMQQQLPLAKEQVDLALKNQRLLQEQVRVLQTTLAHDQAIRERLKNPQFEETVDEPQPADESTEADAPPSFAIPSRPLPRPGAASADTKGGTEQPTAPPEEAGKTERPSRKTAEAQQRAEEKVKEVEEIETHLDQLLEREQTLKKTIDLEKKRLQTARQRQETLDESLRVLEDQFTEKLEAGAPQAELQELRRKIRERELTHREVQTDIAQIQENYQQLRSELLALQAEELRLARQAVAKRREADIARRNEWLVRLQEAVRVKGPRVGLVLLIMFALWWSAAFISGRIVGLLTRAGRGSLDERQNRASTLVSVFQNAANLVITAGGGIILLDLLGVPVQPLLGGAAVLGLAIAFGAQNLIRDYFYGFTILLENQYKLNDLITIGGKTGVVERITMRITLLRDLEGQAHFIPNGEITSVTNRTLGWAQAVFDIGVAYKENVDQVMDLLMNVAHELREDPEFGPAILEDPQMLGVNEFADSAVMIKFLLKTRADRMYPVRREMLRRIKNRFDEVGIEIPFPHRTIFVRDDAIAANGFPDTAGSRYDQTREFER